MSIFMSGRLFGMAGMALGGPTLARTARALNQIRALTRTQNLCYGEVGCDSRLTVPQRNVLSRLLLPRPRLNQD